jgi:hypothetical protein
MSTLALPLPTQKWLRRNWLAVVMLVAYLLLSLLILEQGRIIESQRTLIRELFSDSLQLNAMKVEKHQADQQAPAPSPQHVSQPELQK